MRESLLLPQFNQLTATEKALMNLSVPISSYPMYKQYQLDVKLSDLELKNQKQSRLPQVAAYARYTAQAQRNEFNFFDASQPWFGIGVVGVRLDVPIFSGFQKKSSIQTATLKQQIAKQQLALFEMQQEQQDTALVHRYQSTQLQLDYAIEAYTLASDNYQIAQFKYQNGVYTIEQLITIHNERLAAQNQYLTQLGNLKMYRAIIQVKNELLKEE